MFHKKKAGQSFINRDEYYDKVLGCWTGKNIGGTLGGPFEGTKDVLNLTFYSQKLNGAPAPNDDLDLQLVWLKAIEDHGIYAINERLLGEYWLSHITGPWNEYGVAKFNIINGLFPPLSGSCNNERWKNSNGGWIRSEIWACMFPGEPDEAAPFAWCDACIDHADEGIWAEIFITALEAAAFVENNVSKLIDYALVRIPKDSRVARSVKTAKEVFDSGETWQIARNQVLEANADLGWFQAPANVAFVVIGLLYGKGDFGRSICLAVNCGDDTDCTGATCGAVLGIIKGRSGIAAEWVEPIGDSIRTVAVAPFHARLPVTLQELTDRVLACKRTADVFHPALLRIHGGKTTVGEDIQRLLPIGAETAGRLAGRSSRQLAISLPFGVFAVEFEKGPVAAPGEVQQLSLTFAGCREDNQVLAAMWQLPPDWSVDEGSTQLLMTGVGGSQTIRITLNIGSFSGALVHIPIRFELSGRNYPVFGVVTFLRRGSVSATGETVIDQSFWDREDRCLARI